MKDAIVQTRSNFFAVNDEEEFLFLLGTIVFDGEEPNLEFKEIDGVTKYRISGIGNQIGVVSDDWPDGDDCEDEPDFDLFLSTLQRLLADGEAVILVDYVDDSYSYMVGNAIVITKEKIFAEDGIDDILVAYAREKLRDPNWTTDLSGDTP